MLHELTAEARAFLEAPHFAVLATIAPGGAPQQAVVWYYLDGEEIVFNSRSGRRKDADIARDPRVSLCVAEGYKYIVIRGRAQINTDQAVAQADIKRLAIRYHGPEKGTRMAENDFVKQERISYRVKLDRIAVYGFGG